MTDRFARRTRTAAAVLSAVLLAWLVESGVARHIGPDVFLPVREGIFLPGRMARMAAVLVLCLALALTEQGRALGQKLRTALRKDRYCWLVSGVVTGLFFLWAWRVAVILFMTNDDASIMKAIGSIPEQGLAAAGNTFSHIVFSALLGALYRFDPDGYWYAWYQLAAIFISITVVGRCLYLKLRRHNWPVLAGPALHLAVCVGLFLPAVAELSFTVTPAIVGTAAVALVLCLDETNSRAGRIAAGAASVPLVLLCGLQREETGTALLCFWALAVGYQAVKCLLAGRPISWKTLAALAVLAAATLACLSAVTSLTLADLTGPEPESEAAAAVQPQTAQPEEPRYSYDEAEAYRSRVMDYLLDQMTNEELEQAGLPSELSTLLRAWYFMDERINTDTFLRIIALYDATHAPAAANAESPGSDPNAEAGLWDAFSTRLDTALSNETEGHLACMKLLAAAVGVLAVLCMLRLLLYGLAGWPETLCGLFAAGGAALMWLYLIRIGRFLFRVFLVPAIPAAVIMLLLAADRPVRERPPKTRRAGAALSAAAIAGLCVLSVLTAGHVPYTRQNISRDQVTGAQMAMEQYANASPDITFYTNMISNNLDPFHSATGFPGNIRRWGGTGVTASTDRPYADAFFREDVRLLSDDPISAVLLIQYLTLDWGPVQAAVEDRPGGVYIFRLSRILPEEPGYTGWYEHNGLTYYFEDGQPLTGEQTIDGRRYTFAPPGAQSRFSAAPSDSGLVYFTAAYSLTDPEA